MHATSATVGRSPLALIGTRGGAPYGGDTAAVEIAGFSFDGGDWYGRIFPDLENIANVRGSLGAPFTSYLFKPRFKFSAGGNNYGAASPFLTNEIPVNGNTITGGISGAIWLSAQQIDLVDGHAIFTVSVVVNPSPVQYIAARYRCPIPNTVTGAFLLIPGSNPGYAAAPAAVVFAPCLAINPYTGGAQWTLPP